MRLFVSLSALFISATLLVVYSNSFTTAGMNNVTLLTIAAEEDALIAITYTKGKKFTISNNTDNTITINSIDLNSEIKNEIIKVKVPFTLSPGRSKEFNITADPKELTDGIIEVKAHWNGGSAQIKSAIPNLNEKQTISEQNDTELDSKDMIPETIDEEIDSEIDSELEEGDEE